MGELRRYRTDPVDMLREAAIRYADAEDAEGEGGKEFRLARHLLKMCAMAYARHVLRRNVHKRAKE